MATVVVKSWPWMPMVDVYDNALDHVAVVTIQDSRSARAATGE
jgi:hypothetical protein